MIKTNEKTQARKKSGWAFFCPLSSPRRAATRQLGMFARRASGGDYFSDASMITDPIHTGQGSESHVFLPRTNPCGSPRKAGLSLTSYPNLIIWQFPNRGYSTRGGISVEVLS